MHWKFLYLSLILTCAATVSFGQGGLGKRGGINIGFSLDFSAESRGTPPPERRNAQLPPGTEHEDHGEPIRDYDVIQRFLQQLESHRRTTSFEGIPILGGIVKKARRFQACITPKHDRGHCRHVQHCVLPAFLKNINILLTYSCFIGGAHLGVCCPDRHFSTNGDENDEFDQPPSTTTKRPSVIDSLLSPVGDFLKAHKPSSPKRPESPRQPDAPHHPGGTNYFSTPVPTVLYPDVTYGPDSTTTITSFHPDGNTEKHSGDIRLTTTESSAAWSQEPSTLIDTRPHVVREPTTEKPYHRPPTSTTTAQPARNTGSSSSPAPGSQIQKYSVTCGLNVNKRIVGGEVANAELWSWVAALMKADKRTNKTEQFCGGVIISHRYIVTAAHCLPGIHARDLTIRLGEYDFNEENSRRQDYGVARIVRHPDYNETNNNFADIALIKVNKDIAFNQFLLPVCMPGNETFAEKIATVIGWGVTSFAGRSSNVLKQLRLPVWSNKECQEKISTVKLLREYLCAGLKDQGGNDSCQGDSGGPLMVENENGQWTLIGIVSWGFGCGQKGVPAIYTRVSQFRQWIHENAI